MSVVPKIGFMQGRLSPPVGGKIQAFPWCSWPQEFPLAEASGFSLMEWTLDHERLYENPLLTTDGQATIAALKAAHHIEVPSLTGDCFMQEPFWKATDDRRQRLMRDFVEVVKACRTVGISMLIIPLVDNGRINSVDEELVLVKMLRDSEHMLAELAVKVVFESDFEPQALRRFIDAFPSGLFGINYDIGNSASLGFDPRQEIETYGDRILNVHVKDRIRGGSTVPLGKGAADFMAVFRALKRLGSTPNLILQTARAADGNHAGALRDYRTMVDELWQAA